MLTLLRLWFWPAVLAACAGFVWWLWAANSRLEQTLGEREAELAATQAALTALRAGEKRLTTALSERETAMADIRRRYQTALSRLNEVKHHDEHVKNWADTAVPVPVLRLLKDVTPAGDPSVRP